MKTLLIIMGVMVLIITVVASVILYVWMFGDDFASNWFNKWFAFAAITFLLGAGIVLSGLLIERGVRRN